VSEEVFGLGVGHSGGVVVGEFAIKAFRDSVLDAEIGVGKYIPYGFCEEECEGSAVNAEAMTVGKGEGFKAAIPVDRIAHGADVVVDEGAEEGESGARATGGK